LLRTGKGRKRRSRCSAPTQRKKGSEGPRHPPPCGMIPPKVVSEKSSKKKGNRACDGGERPSSRDRGRLLCEESRRGASRRSGLQKTWQKSVVRKRRRTTTSSKVQGKSCTDTLRVCLRDSNYCPKEGEEELVRAFSEEGSRGGESYEGRARTNGGTIMTAQIIAGGKERDHREVVLRYL